MTLRTVAGGRKSAESVDDLVEWLWELRGCPRITRTLVASCTRPAHGDEPATWFYAEADAVAGVARTRCLSCGDARPVLDSAERWTYPPAWSCSGCAQPIAEVAFGISQEDGVTSWLVMAARCVSCGQIDGLTDIVVPGLAEETFAAAL